MTEDFQLAFTLLTQSSRSLIFTHQRPDGDALGSSFGLKSFLKSIGKEAEVFIPGAIPNRHSKIFAGALGTLTQEQFDSFDTIIAVDCANPDRLGAPEFLDIDTLRKLRFINIDHHGGNSMMSGFFNLVSPESSSCCELLVQLLSSCGAVFSQESATFFLTGMMTDTGCFRFSNTDAETMRTAAVLFDSGAELERIVNALFFSKPLSQTRFENELMNDHLQISHGGKTAFAFISGSLLKKHDFDLKEDEGIIDLLREIDGVVIAILFHRSKDGVKVSMRSKDRNFPVGPVARFFGGGGHELAAGATVDASDDDAVKMVINKIGEMYNW